MKKVRFATPVLVLLAILLVGILPASAGQPGTGTTTIYVQNADPSNSAQIIAEFYNLDGSSVGTVNVTSLPPYVGYTVNTGDASPALPSSWNGSVVVSSDRQVAAVGHTVYLNVPTASDGLTAGDYTALATPQNTSFLAYVFNSSGRNSIFGVQNTESSQATVYLHYIRRSDGTELAGSGTCSGSPVIDTIPANGVVYYDLLNQTRNGAYSGGGGGTIPCMDAAGTSQPAAGTLGGFEGAVYITSTNELAVASSTHWANYEGLYTGATGDDTLLYFPQITRVKNSGGSWVRWSAIIVQNTQTFPISITVSLLGDTGNSVVFSHTVPALSSMGYNTRFKGNFPDSMWVNCTDANRLEPSCWLENALGTRDWLGSATVQVNTPGGRIVGVNHVIYSDGRTFTYEGLQPSTAGQIAVCPIMLDKGLGSNQHWSAAILQNTSSMTATVDVYLFTQGNGTGGLGGADLTLDNGGAGYEIAAGERLGFNTRFDVTGGPAASVFDPLGNDWTGSLAVISRDEPILVTMSMFRAQGSTNWGTDYNCYNVP